MACVKQSNVGRKGGRGGEKIKDIGDGIRWSHVQWYRFKTLVSMLVSQMVWVEVTLTLAAADLDEDLDVI